MRDRDNRSSTSERRATHLDPLTFVYISESLTFITFTVLFVIIMFSRFKILLIKLPYLVTFSVLFVATCFRF